MATSYALPINVVREEREQLYHHHHYAQSPSHSHSQSRHGGHTRAHSEYTHRSSAPQTPLFNDRNHSSSRAQHPSRHSLTQINESINPQPQSVSLHFNQELVADSLPHTYYGGSVNNHNHDRGNHGHVRFSHTHSHSHSHDHRHGYGLPSVPRSPLQTDSSLRDGNDTRSVEHSKSHSAFHQGDATLHTISKSSRLLTGVLLCLPYIFAAASFSSGSDRQSKRDDFPPLAAYARENLGDWTDLLADISHQPMNSRLPAAIQTCSITSATLLLVGILALVTSTSSPKTNHSRNGRSSSSKRSIAEMCAEALALILTLALPFFASMQLGGTRVAGCMLLLTLAKSTTSTDVPHTGWITRIRQRMACACTLLACAGSDLLGWTTAMSRIDVAFGYLALFCFLLLLDPSPKTSDKDLRKSSITFFSTSQFRADESSPDAHVFLLAGALLGGLTVVASMITLVAPPITTQAIFLSSCCIATTAAATFFAQLQALQDQPEFSAGTVCILTAISAFLFSPSLWPGTLLNGGFAGLTFLAVLYDFHAQMHYHAQGDDSLTSAHATNQHHNHTHLAYSPVTKLIISRCESGSLLHEILSEKDSRRIAYFTVLNLGFMMVQGFYGYLSGSLGLLSDTVHMFFDCLGLVVGLGAAVASRWPTSPDMPYGWGKLNTLAGFGNGIFLMLVSIEFVWEAIEGIVEAKELRHVEELMLVSVMGFLVNMVGLFAFGHAHAGHDHGHSHSHSHGHSHNHSHSHSHSHSHDHDHSAGRTQREACSHSHQHKSEHSDKATSVASHDHHNENMHGIFLHVAADAGGSLAVIISTALTLWQPWYLWDPLATIIIAILIFAMAIPLVLSSGRKLLLVIPDQAEYTIKETLQELGELRGVVGYAGPRFWLDDRESNGAHDHRHHDEHNHHDHHHDHNDHNHGHHGSHSHHDHHHDHSTSEKASIAGVIHIVVSNPTIVEDVRIRVQELFISRGMDVVVQVEVENGSPCWCRSGSGGDGGSSSSSSVSSSIGNHGRGGVSPRISPRAKHGWPDAAMKEI